MGAALGLATMSTRKALQAPPPMQAAPQLLSNPRPHPGNFPGKAKTVIHIFAQGAPSHIDTWDPKPQLLKMDGKTLADGGVAMGSPFKFTPMGQSGIQVSELFSKVGAHVDDMAVINSMYTDSRPGSRAAC